ncbi:MAG: alpha/beta hydrolase [Flavobacteriales bacterium]|nr:alpha/beta hydrolase [Flavobacteriales bacterium]
MKQLLILSTFLLSMQLHGQVQRAPLQLGEQLTLHSEVLNEDRILNVFLPQDYSDTASYPVLYVLDGSWHEDFIHICGLVQFFNLQYAMPNMIVVGISNVDRKRDFTHHTDMPEMMEYIPTGGYSGAFISFLESELLPVISGQYSTSGENWILGQSLGGLLASEVLLNKPDLFSRYLIVSPSLWWDDESMLHRTGELLKDQDLSTLQVDISVGLDEHPTMVKDAAALYESLSGLENPPNTLRLNVMTGENHASILHNAVYEALESWFPMEE